MVTTMVVEGESGILLKTLLVVDTRIGTWAFFEHRRKRSEISLSFAKMGSYTPQAVAYSAKAHHLL